MHITSARTAVTALAMITILAAAEKRRGFITESAASKLSGDGSVGPLKGSLAFTGGTSPQNVETTRQ